MIVVIADDITGAAELGGIGLRYGLTVRIAEDVPLQCDVDLLVIYTNTRSMKKGEAVGTMKRLTQKAKALHPSLFYKKTDSVLRGHVLAEMEAQMKVYEAEKGLLIPVNPSLGRTIQDGQYFVHRELVHQTSFANDPEFPIRSAEVEEMLGSDNVDVIKTEAEINGKGVYVGEASSVSDIDKWVSVIDESILCAGGASFFDALLRKRFNPSSTKKTFVAASPTLLVSGTTFGKNVQRIQAYANLVSYMPDEIFANERINESDIERWADEVADTLAKKQKAIVAIGEKSAVADSNLLRSKMSELVKRVFQKITIHELLIEGGSTAYSIIEALGWQCFVPENELAQGVVRMKVVGHDGVHITIKPGSYEWPVEWDFA